IPPHKTTHPATATQATHRQEFVAAVHYARGSKDTPEYKALAKAKGISSFNVAVRDFFKPPVVQSIDLTAYTGDQNQNIVIHATDDVKVQSVSVAIAPDAGASVEEGAATLAADGTWTYTTTVKPPAGALKIAARAMDLAGNIAQLTATK